LLETSTEILWSLYNSQACGTSGLSVIFSQSSKLHPIFHVSCLKKVIGTKFQTQTDPPELDKEGSILLQPQAILDHCEILLRQQTIKELLFQWKDTTPTYTTWKPATILQQFPHPKP
jgi:hypothetical protein